MSDQPSFQPPPPEEFFEVRQYVSTTGRQVNRLTRLVTGSTAPGAEPRKAVDATSFRGMAMLMVNTPQGMQQVPFAFQFPPEVTTVEHAFAKFDESVRAALKEQQERQAREEARQIITPRDMKMPPGLMERMIKSGALPKMD